MITRRALLASVALTGCSVGQGGTASAAFGPAPERAPDVLPNSLTLHDASGSGVSQYPLRLGRPFAAGEMRGPPQALIDGVPVPTQTDIKTRWPDGSVQHAVMFLIVPRISAGGKITISFRAQPATSGEGLSAAQMLAPEFDFDAVMEISSGGETHSASARAMLQAGNYSIWSAGPIATSIILADHSVQRRYDMGFDALRSVRPIFHATFWPALRRVQVRVIGENANTETLQDLLYDLALKAGAAGKPVFSQAGVPHYLATRWTRSFWIGGEPEQRIDIDHNLAYLGTTRTFPAYDTSLRISEQIIDRSYQKWLKAPRNLYDAGGWMKPMPSAGGRDDIGPYTGWVIRWLYSGDHRLFEIVEGMAGLAGAWPLHIREGRADKFLDAEHRVPGIGRIISGLARPTAWVLDDRDRAKPEDRVVLHGTRLILPGQKAKEGGWHSDGAHQPDPYSALYALTGDPFMLEQLQLWAATQAVHFNPNYKGPPGSGVIVEEVRGHAWVFRSRALTVFLSPDGSPEKAYLRRLLDDAMGYWEGVHGISGTPFEGSPCWRFGTTKPFRPPLHLWGENPNSRPDFGLLPSIPNSVSFWQNYFVIFELGRAKDLGFPTGPLLSWAGVMLTSQFREPQTYSFYNVERYWSPARKPDGTFFQTWTDTLTSYRDQTVPTVIKPDAADGYAAYAYGASTMLTQEPGGRVAYDWLRKAVFEFDRERYPQSPKWALLPRA